MNIYKALVTQLNENVEEEVSLIINGIELTCFAGICPYEIHVGKEYNVLLDLMIFNDYCVNKADFMSKKISRIERGFSYLLTGKLDGSVIDCGIQFNDEILLSDFGYLDGQFIQLKVDRIDVEFLSE